MRQPISNDPSSGTVLLQEDDPQSYLQSIGCGDIDYLPKSSRELHFEAWRERIEERDADRLRRIEAAGKSIAQDRARVERAELIRRRQGKGFR